ncbi:hypothetical protein BGX21_000430 [Mortierella sp. AD011]|nr:hypothetical protein BGX20_001501 [Mortierella sp. AD010]KAF9387954.1 hypothetical protein BGX21_000430 [Mortierella sp. AD011]
MTTINTMSARCLFNQQSNNNNNDGSDLPSPISPTVITTTALPILDLLLIHLQQRDSSSTTASSSSPSQIPEGIPVSEEERARLSSELAQLKKLTTEAQQTYMTIHGTIQQYQQLVLSTHAQVAAAKRSLMQAREISNSMMNNNNNKNNSNHNLYSNGSSRTSSPPSSPTSVAMPSSTSMSMSISSPRSRSDSFSFSFGTSISNSIIEEDKEEINEGIRLKMLEQEHESLGRKLTQLLRDKAAAEETKKRMNDGLLKAKARIKELEQKLGK